MSIFFLLVSLLACFQTKRTLPNYILNERDPSIKNYGGRKIEWFNWNVYMPGFVCRCARKAKELGYDVFGIQFYGENEILHWFVFISKSSSRPTCSEYMAYLKIIPTFDKTNRKFFGINFWSFQLLASKVNAGQGKNQATTTCPWVRQRQTNV